MALKFAEYDYKAGKINCNADALSRNPVPQPNSYAQLYPLTRADSDSESLFDWTLKH